MHISSALSPSASLAVCVQATLAERTPLVHPYSASYGRTNISTILATEDGGRSLAGKTLTVGGWVKSGREQGGGEFFFIQLNDGSIFTDLQVRAHAHLDSWLCCSNAEGAQQHRH